MSLGTVSFLDNQFDIKVYAGERLGNNLCIDTETEICPFHMTPDIVTMQAFNGKDVYYIPKDRINEFFNVHDNSTFILHNFAFDFGVLEKHLGNTSIFYKIMDEHRIEDTSILYRLWYLGKIGHIPFKYNLKLLCKEFFNVELDKEGQTLWTPYLNVALEEIPQSLIEYGALDVITTYYLYSELRTRITPMDKYGTLLSHNIQVKGEYALNKIYKNGIGFDLESRDVLLTELNQKLEDEALVLDLYGWRRGLKGMKDRFDSICETYEIDVPFTADLHRSSKGEDLIKYSGNQFVDAYLAYHSVEKATTFIRGIESERVHPRYNSLVNTGRTSCSKPNFQQLPRLGGIREMFKANTGSTFIITDYSTLELATLAQVTYERYGYSVMRDKINDGEDLHKYYASVMNRCSIDMVTKEMRQQAKAANFGFPGGLGAETFVTFCKGYGLKINEEEAKEMKKAWFEAFPEMVEYMKNEDGHVTTLTGRLRGNTTYCAEKNTPFQGLAADGAKLAMYNLQKQGFKIVGFVHDEIICETNSKGYDEKLRRQEQIMIDSMKQVVPDVKISVESMISERYCK
jgi:DNA polymerase I-like protein with 3'-5' exonuclease and polymerase domains